MKKLIPIILLLLFSLMLVACNGSTNNVNGTQGNEKTTQKTYYSYGSEGFSIVKQELDEKGATVRETLCLIDEEFGIIAPAMSVSVIYGESGNIESAEGRYLSLSVHAKPQTKFTLTKSANPLYSYEISVGDAVQAYITETRDENGKTVKTEYFTRGGRLMLTEFTEYHENGERKSTRTTGADGETACTCTYNEQGNIISSTVTDGETTTTVTAEYYESGIIKSYTQNTSDDKKASLTVSFNEQGSVTKYKDFFVTYANDGITPVEVKKDFTYYSFDENGCVTQKTENPDLPSETVTQYTYDAEGRLIIASTTKALRVQSKFIYEYNADGTYEQTVHGINNRKEKIVIYNALGMTLSEEKFNQNVRSTYQTYEYDSYGQLIKSKYYNGTLLGGTAEYSYNTHGDVIEEKLTGSFGNAHNTYQYYDNGKLRLAISLDSGRPVATVEYFEDGSICKTFHSGANYTSQTYNKDGKLTENTVFYEGVKQTQTYEYYGNGTDKCTEIYVNNVLTDRSVYDENGKLTELISTDENGVQTRAVYEYYSSGGVRSVIYYNGTSYAGGSELLENGNVSKTYLVDENGVLYTTEYVRENGVPVRVNTYAENTLYTYSLLEYYTYKNDKVNNLKSMRSYDAEANLILSTEYAQIKVQDSKDYVYVLVKEEAFENGVLAAYFYAEYSEETGYIANSLVLSGGIRVETMYDTRNNGKVTFEKTYNGDVLVSVYEGISAPEIYPVTYAMHFYKENGVLEYSIVYDPHNDEPEYKYVYEYGEDGKLKGETRYKLSESEDLVSEIIEYGENGAAAKKEAYFYNSDNTPNGKKIYTYDADGRLLSYSYYKMRSGSTLWEINVEEFYEYDENGLLIKKIVKSYASGARLSQTVTEEYDSKGRVIHSLTERQYNSQELFVVYNENDDIVSKKYYSNGVLSEHLSKEFDEEGRLIYEYSLYNSSISETNHTYNDQGLPAETVVRKNGEIFRRYVYEYRENGKITTEFQYTNGEITLERQYDENGSIIS